MKHYKKLSLIYCLVLTSLYTHAQKEKKKVYFLVDTLNVAKQQRVIEIGNEYEIYYTFYCRCLPPVTTDKPYEDLKYSFINTKEVRMNVTDKKPDVRYISWREFLNLAVRPSFFSDNYDFYITEALPNEKYRTNKVTLQRSSWVESKQKIE